MIPGLPLTLGFTPDDTLIDYLVQIVDQRHIPHPIAKSIIKQLLDSVTSDFVDGRLEYILANGYQDDIYNACYATYRPSNCRCFTSEYIYFNIFLFSTDDVNYDIVHIALSDESILDIMPARQFYPTAEDRYK